ncbi:zinc finger C2HC domain-containing protein 1C isoform X2 [Eupeodes corollae]|uniref:zinc finger C2HC domain-containing protein 1C isoform X2 n=1 Tax=Eupeodes corollae TaxID=290404 RepID=UPI002493A0E5|nr:zinc finger C2HC domain-containing protein 1C isoform X2 [Eupeodes corollae]
MNIPEFSALARFSSDSALNNNYHQIVPTKLNESWAGRRLLEALNQLPPSKFGSSTDIRFQQKQLQVREQRKMEMTAPKSDMMENAPINVKSNKSTNLNSSIGNGKVRQMFNERRRGAGIDRSNPLKPITSRSSSSSSTITTTPISSKTNTVRKLDRTTTNKLAVLKISNGNDSVDYISNEKALETYRVIEDDLDNETFPEQQLDNFDNLLPAKLEALMLDNFGEDTNNNNMSENKTSIKLNPVLTKKSPPITSKTPVKTSRSSLSLTSKSNSTLNSSQKLAPSEPKNPTIVKSSSKMAKPMASPKISLRLPRAKTPPFQPPGTAPCKLCNRFFNEDRLSKHEEVCEKMAMKKRKIFDASKHRVKGTEAEKYLKKPLRGARTVAKNPSTISTNTNSTTEASAKKSNWRKKHEEFIAAIRAAKEVQAYLAKGGKLSDLPPPPPSENPDYVTCPHCSRRFNEAAANRHIPKCANMLHNKPKPAAKRSLK